MSRDSGPDLTLPSDDQRCGAKVRGKTKGHGGAFEWQRVDHRCPRPANQGRAGIQVCHVHARSRELIAWQD